MLFVRNPSGVSHSPAEYAEARGLRRRGNRAGGRARRPGRIVSQPAGGPPGRVACRAGLAARVGHPGRRADPGGRGTASTAVTAGAFAPAGLAPGNDQAGRADGLPGLAKRALARVSPGAARPRPRAGRGTFWTWRERMYEVAARLDPGRYFAPGPRRVRGDGPWPGSPAVGEFHYLHHDRGGGPVRRPERDGPRASSRRPADAGLRICLIDACYLSGGLSPAGEPLPAGRPAGPPFADGPTACRRVGPPGSTGPGLGCRPAGGRPRPGSVRPSTPCAPSPPAQVGPVAQWAAQRPGAAARAPVRAAGREPGVPGPPTAPPRPRSWSAPGALGQRTTVVHATHLSPGDIAPCWAGGGVYACFCPTTEADLADGIGPAARPWPRRAAR